MLLNTDVSLATMCEMSKAKSLPMQDVASILTETYSLTPVQPGSNLEISPTTGGHVAVAADAVIYPIVVLR